MVNGSRGVRTLPRARRRVRLLKRSFAMDAAQMKRLTALARQRGCSRSLVLRNALSYGLPIEETRATG